MNFLHHSHASLFRWPFTAALTLGLALIASAASPMESATIKTNWLTLPELLKKWEGASMAEVTHAATNGDASAQHYMGYCETEGFRTERDPRGGALWYERALQSGYLPAANNLGLIYQRGLLGSNDPARAIYYFTFAADRGLAQAQANLGYLYRDGKGVEKNPVKAVKWFQQAAAQGHATAMVEIGRLYRFGLGQETNLAAAEEWFQRAARTGSALAQFNLGLLYESEGRRSEAFNFYQQAAERGFTDGMTKLYYCYWEGNGVASDHAKAMTWLTQAAGANNAWAQYLMGYRCENTEWEGESPNAHLPPPDLIGALKWYRRSAEQNWANGQYRLGLFYLEGKVVRRDETRGLELVRAAADQNLTDALSELAALYAQGIGEPRDSQDRPIELLERAGAWSDLIFRYEYGLGTKRDLVTAARCCCQAALAGAWNNATLAEKVKFHPSKRLKGSELLTPRDGHAQIYGPWRESGGEASDDVLRVLSLYLKAADGNGMAAGQIGRMYLDGQDAPKNPAQAWLWSSLAVRNGLEAGRQMVSTAEASMTDAEISASRSKLLEMTQELTQVASALHQ